MDWRPMTEHVFPWEHRDMLVLAFDKEEPNDIAILRCVCAEHGALFPAGGSIISIHEDGWIPFAWQIDTTPMRDDAKWPPLWTDYLTEAEEQ